MLAVLYLAAVLPLLAQGREDAGPLRAVSSVELDRYSGKWYEIAKYPNRFQRQCVANTIARYSLKNDGRIEVVNSCMREDGSIDTAKAEARIADKSSNAKLKVRFAPGVFSWLPFVWANYWIVYLADDYSYAMVSEPGRNCFWILGRTPAVDEETYQAMIRRAAAMGFDASRIVRTPQNASVRDGRVVPAE